MSKRILCLLMAFTMLLTGGCGEVAEVVSAVLEGDGGGAATEAPPAEAADLPTEAPAEEDKPEEEIPIPEEIDPDEDFLPESGVYSSREDVALYLHLYGRLPENFITKKEANALGWEGGSLEPYAPGMCIGGDRFGNYEGLLPEKDGRQYYECDVDTLGAEKRGPKRIVFSNDGLIYYTDDHYESFTLLYGEEE